MPPHHILGKKSNNKGKNLNLKFVIDCSQPVEDKVLVMKDFQDFLKQRIKVHGKTGHLQDDIVVKGESKSLDVTSSIPLSKRYLKYLTKKYLKKQQLRDYLHVVATEKNKYQLKYFNIQQDELDEE